MIRRFIIVCIGGMIAMFNRIVPAMAAADNCSLYGTGDTTKNALSSCVQWCNMAGNKTVMRAYDFTTQTTCTGITGIAVTADSYAGTLTHDDFTNGGVQTKCPNRYNACTAWRLGAVIDSTGSTDSNGSPNNITCADLACIYSGYNGGDTESGGGAVGGTDGCASGYAFWRGDENAFLADCYLMTGSTPTGVTWGADTGIAGPDGNLIATGATSVHQSFESGFAVRMLQSGLTTGMCQSCDAVTGEVFWYYRCAGGYYFIDSKGDGSKTEYTGTDHDTFAHQCSLCPDAGLSFEADFTPTGTTGTTGTSGATGDTGAATTFSDYAVCVYGGCSVPGSYGAGSCFTDRGRDKTGTFRFGSDCYYNEYDE